MIYKNVVNKCFFIFCFIFVSLNVQAKLKLKTFNMHVGEVKVLPINKVDRVAIGRSDVVNYQILDNGQLLLIAKARGETYLHIWEHKNRELKFIVNVTQDNMSRELKMAKALSADIDGLKVRQVNGNIIFEGVVSNAEKEKLQALISAVPNAIPMMQFKEFDVKEMTRLDVRIVELNKKAASQIGIRWQQTMSGPILGFTKSFETNNFFRVFQDDPSGINEDIISSTPNDTGFYSYFGITSSISSTIDLMAETGDARILATPKLIAKSGESAEFLSGGSFPVLIVNSLGQSEVEFRDYGIKISMLPVIDADKNINTLIHAEVSSIDLATEVNDVPGVLTREVDTTINLKDNETIVISGLASVLESKQVTKVPVLGDLPLIGNLFKSTEKVRQETEIVIFVTPRIISPNHEKNQELVDYGIELRDHFNDKRVNQALME